MFLKLLIVYLTEVGMKDNDDFRLRMERLKKIREEQLKAERSRRMEDRYILIFTVLVFLFVVIKI